MEYLYVLCIRWLLLPTIYDIYDMNIRLYSLSSRVDYMSYTVLLRSIYILCIPVPGSTRTIVQCVHCASFCIVYCMYCTGTCTTIENTVGHLECSWASQILPFVDMVQCSLQYGSSRGMILWTQKSSAYLRYTI